MIQVVSDTSPLTNLAAIGHFNLLRDLFGRIEIADAVWQELNAAGHSWPGRDEVAGADWIIRHAPGNLALFTALRRNLDPGESASIALALKLSADLILIDEQDGRHEAKRHGLETTGVIGVLLLAKRRGLVGSIRPLLSALRSRAGFWISQTFCERALRDAGELS